MKEGRGGREGEKEGEEGEGGRGGRRKEGREGREGREEGGRRKDKEADGGTGCVVGRVVRSYTTKLWQLLYKDNVSTVA